MFKYLMMFVLILVVSVSAQSSIDRDFYTGLTLVTPSNYNNDGPNRQLSLMVDQWVFGSDITLDNDYLSAGDTIAAYLGEEFIDEQVLIDYSGYENVLPFLPLCHLCDTCMMPYLCPVAGDTVTFCINGQEVISYPTIIFGERDPINDELQHRFPNIFVRLRSFISCVPGDANGDGVFNVGDLTYLIAYLFQDGPIPTPDGDMNSDGTINIGDVTYALNALFFDGPKPTCN